MTTDGRVITESSAISRYLIDKYDTANKFQGDAKNDAIRDEELTSLGSTNLSTFLTMELLFQAAGTRSPFFIRPLINGIGGALKKAFLGPEIKAQLNYLNDQLGDQDYFMGSSPGRADFMISWPIDMSIAPGLIDLNEYPKIKAWHERCKARDGWKRSIEKGNGYDLKW